MMLDRVDIAGGEIGWLCSFCGVDNLAEIGSLVLGNGLCPNTIVLPPCKCGAQMNLTRTWESHVDLPHRRVINSLAQHLKDSGKSHPGVAARHSAETTEPPLLADLSQPFDDLTGRKKHAKDVAAVAARAAMTEADRPAREAAEKAAREAAEAAEEERLFQLAEQRRRDAAVASVNKRHGRPPGSEVSSEELDTELAKNASEIQGATDERPRR